MTTIANSKDAMAQAKVRMEKAVDDFRKELSSLPHRPRKYFAARSHSRRLSRHIHARESAWVSHCSGINHADGYSVGSLTLCL